MSPAMLERMRLLRRLRQLNKYFGKEIQRLEAQVDSDDRAAYGRAIMAAQDHLRTIEAVLEALIRK